MSLITVIIVLIAVGVLLWAVKTYIPLDPTLSKIITAVVIIGVIVWLLKIAGIWQQLSNVRVELPTQSTQQRLLHSV